MCSKCKKKKEVSAFGVKNYNKDGLNHYCKKCENERSKIKYSDPDQREKAKYRQIKNNYGLTKEQYLQMLVTQHNQCKICEAKLLNDKNTHIDHCHKTGKIRGVLCKSCNHLLGNLKDDLTLINKIIQYLKN